MTTDTQTDKLPNLSESDLADVWRLRCEEKYIEDSAREHRKHAEGEILRRAIDAEAQVIGTRWGDITIIYPATYAYDSRVVDGEFWALIERDNLQADYKLRVSHVYKINRTWLNQLAKRGAEYRDVIERMTQSASGSPKIEGPTLEQIDEADTRKDTIL